MRCTDLIGLKIWLAVAQIADLLKIVDRHPRPGQSSHQTVGGIANRSPIAMPGGHLHRDALLPCPRARTLAGTPANGVRHGELQRLVTAIKDWVGLTIQANKSITR